MECWSLLVIGTLALGAASSETPVLRELAATGTELLRNGDFRRTDGERAADWQPYEDGGYRVIPGAGRQGTAAIHCENTTERSRSGAVQRLDLKRTRPAPILVSGWSRAEGVSGSPNADYSLYVDIEYTDGTPLWGQVAPFAVGTHGWQKAEILIMPEKPVAVLSLHCLFRAHSGRVWFDDVSAREFSAGSEGTLFDGRPVARGAARRAARGGVECATRDGLVMRYDAASASVAALRLGGRPVRAPGAPSGFLVRDVAAGAAVHGFRNGRCSALGLTLTARATAAAGHVTLEGEVRDQTGKDRALTVFFALPFPRQEGTWHQDGRVSRPLTTGEYSFAAPVGAGATGTMSRYPWACVTGPAGGLGLGIDMDRPAQYRLFYNADLQALVLAYDFALVPDTKRFPSAAPFRFVVFPVDAEWGFRSAADRYQRIFPEYYVVRSRKQGLWMPFTDVSTVQGWQDFGFRYHEGDNNVPFDDSADILSFTYTEPSTYWMPMPPEMPRTRDAALAELRRLRDQGSPGQRRWAEATLNANLHDANGEPSFRFENAPWCNGAVWGLCPLPHLPGEVNAATLHWNPQAREARHGPQAKGMLDGEYLDSLEGYVTAELNYRRDHFAVVQAPLTFDTMTRRPAIHKALAVWEFTRWIAADVHAMNKLMFANSVPYRFAFLTPYLDIMGTETNWLWQGRYQPADDATMLQFRTLSGAKPYLLLMNTDYDRFTPDLVERYFQRSMFYGIYPSMFSHNAAENPYWQNPAWYNRDRELFKRYIPAIRQVGEAGWQPITLARCEQAWVERFGPAADGGACYFTLLNPDARAVEAELRLSPGAPPAQRLVDLVSGESFTVRDGKASIPLGPDTCRALRVVP